MNSYRINVVYDDETATTAIVEANSEDEVWGSWEAENPDTRNIYMVEIETLD